MEIQVEINEIIFIYPKHLEHTNGLTLENHLLAFIRDVGYQLGEPIQGLECFRRCPILTLIIDF